MKRSLCLAAVLVAAVPVIGIGDAHASGWQTVAHDHWTGPDEMTLDADIKNPHGIRMSVTTSKSKGTVHWAITCGDKKGSKQKHGTFKVAGGKTKIKKLPLIFTDDQECLPSAASYLKGAGGMTLKIQKLT